MGLGNEGGQAVIELMSLPGEWLLNPEPHNYDARFLSDTAM
jgi:hypothetical protein